MTIPALSSDPSLPDFRVPEICIIGAGPVGGALACRLAAAGIPTMVIDRAPLPPMEHPDFDGRAYAISAGSRRLLDQAGLWECLPLPSGPIEQIRVTDGRIGRPASPGFVHFDHREVSEDPFGWMIEARSLRLAINRRMHELPALTVRAPEEASVRFTPDGAEVTLRGGACFTTRLVVAAEGRNSPLRKQVGIRVTQFPYRQHAITCSVAHEKPHHSVALEHFLPDGPFAQLPMAGTEGAPHLSALVWSDRAERVPRFMAMDEASFTRELQRRLGDHLGAIRPLGRRWTYPLSALLAHRIVAERLALVGDAAHGIHPIAGQGLNLGFRDAILLGDLLEEAFIAGEDPGSPALLARYQARRRPDNFAMLAATDALDRLFAINAPPVRLARDLGLAAVNRMPRLKRMFMRSAMGLRA